jgi:hypothetical protein
VLVRLPGKQSLQDLQHDLAEAEAEHARAVETLQAAEKHRDSLEGLDAAEWDAASVDVTAKRSEADRLERAAASLKDRTLAEARRVGDDLVAKAEAVVVGIDREITEHEQALDRLRDQRDQAQEAVHDAKDEALDLRAPLTGERRTSDRLTALHVRHPSRDHELTRSQRARVEKVRAERATRATQERDRYLDAVRAGRVDGVMVVDEPPETRIDRIRP